MLRTRSVSSKVRCECCEQQHLHLSYLLDGYMTAVQVLMNPKDATGRDITWHNASALEGYVRRLSAVAVSLKLLLTCVCADMLLHLQRDQLCVLSCMTFKCITASKRRRSAVAVSLTYLCVWWYAVASPKRSNLSPRSASLINAIQRSYADLVQGR